MRPWYRFMQVWASVTARPLAPAAQQEIADLLPPPALALFGRFGRSDQQHSYAVMRLLRQAGCTDPDLLTAALLHDVGKTEAPVGIIGRSWSTVCYKLLPQQAAVWGQTAWDTASFWQRPLIVYSQHPAWSAQLAAEAGCSPRALHFIRHHQDQNLAITPETPLLQQLQWADDQC